MGSTGRRSAPGGRTRRPDRTPGLRRDARGFRAPSAGAVPVFSDASGLLFRLTCPGKGKPPDCSPNACHPNGARGYAE
ncbi:hypothetical protein GCM10019016_133740 [Streptomyces prasinosporus]|uniref:Uncharacterized protein n=1 Tax=Streptomyces prasinosporus TaxID=68256 RepID=A0ABP6UH22_9ACTN